MVELSGAGSQSKWDETLRSIVQGPAASTGDEFFRAPCPLCRCFRICAWDTRVRTLAFWTGEGFLDNFEYDLVNTPCEQDS